MKHQVSTLSGPLLDAAVALAMGWVVTGQRSVPRRLWYSTRAGRALRYPVDAFRPSEDPGLFLELWFGWGIDVLSRRVGVWEAQHQESDVSCRAANPDTAVLRCFVLSKLGREVDLPDVVEAPAAPGATT